MATVGTAMTVMLRINPSLRLVASAMWPKRMAPRGRVINPMAKTPQKEKFCVHDGSCMSCMGRIAQVGRTGRRVSWWDVWYFGE